MKKVLITGGAGNIGSSLVRGLLETDKHHVTVLDNLSTGSIQNLPENSLKNFNFVNGDVNRLKDVNKIFND